MKEIAGIHFYMDALAPEVRMAQAIAEIQQLSTYRAKRLQKYKDWADPVKRAEIHTKTKLEEQASRGKLGEIDAEKIAVRTGEPHYKVKE